MGSGTYSAPNQSFMESNLNRSNEDELNIDLTNRGTRIDKLSILPYNSLSRDEQDMIVNVTREYPFDYANVMFGYIMPFVLVITLFTNTLVVMVLAQRHMRTPTNIVLFTMAIVDLMTLLSPSPWYFYIYTLGYHDSFLHPPSACYAHHIMTDVIPVFFHTSSIWLALLLASQRYIYVCHPTLASTWCTVPRVRKAIFIILLIALLHQLTRFFDNTYVSISIQYEHRIHMACKNEISEWVQNIDVGLYFSTYYTFRILFVFIIPCVALITLNCLLFRALRKAKNKRTELMMKECTTLNNARLSLKGCECAATTAVGSHCRTESSAVNDDDNNNSNAATSSRTARLSADYHKLYRKQRNNNKTDFSLLFGTNTTTHLKAPLVVSADANAENSHCKEIISQAAKKDRHRNLMDRSGLPVVGAALNTQPEVTSTASMADCGRGSQLLPLPTHSSHLVTSSSASLRNLDSNRTTLMLIVVVTVFLMVEVPVAIVTIAHVVLNSFDIFKEVEYGFLNYIKLFTNFIIMISYSVNFTIYCSMSKKFRETFKDLFLFGERARKRKANQKQQLHQQQHQTTRGEQETGVSGRTRNGQPMIIFM